MPDVLAAIHARRGQPFTGPREFSDETLRTTARLIATDSASYTATVSLWGSEPIAGVPCAPSTYTGIESVHVLVQQSRPVQVLGPATTAQASTPAPLAQPSSMTVVKDRVITPVWTGTWRVTRAAWDAWNTTTFGGRSDVYQGSTATSGTLLGFAGYGNQLEALGASVITRATLTLVSNGAASAAWTASVQGSTYGTRPPGTPSFEGSIATGTVEARAGKVTTITLPTDVIEDMRIGHIRGLGLVGAAYGGTYGTSNARSWVLTVDYEVTS